MNPLDSDRGIGLEMGCSNRRGYEHERNHQFRFRTVLGGGNTTDPRQWIPSKAGNRSLPWLNTLGGNYFVLNPVTATGHNHAGTCRAPLWRMLGIGHARTDQLTGQQAKENDRATHWEPCGFLSLFHFRSDKYLSLVRPGLLRFSLGGFLCFLLSLFVLIAPVSVTCTI